MKEQEFRNKLSKECWKKNRHNYMVVFNHCLKAHKELGESEIIFPAVSIPEEYRDYIIKKYIGD